MAVHVRSLTRVTLVMADLALLSAATAVYCFLVLSGYSIAHSIHRNSKHFYRRRLVRVYPLYAVGILLGVAACLLPGARYPVNGATAVSNLFFLETFFSTSLPANGVLWTVAVEVACYACAPWFARRSTRTLCAIAAASATAFAVFGLIIPTRYYSVMLYGEPLALLAWAWLAGFIYYRVRHAERAGFYLLLGFIILTTFSTWYVLPIGRDHQITSCITIGLLVAGHRIKLKPFVHRALTYLGDLSYPLYVVHWPIMLVCVDTFHIHAQSALVAVAIVAAVVSLEVDNRIKPVFSRMIDAAADALGSWKVPAQPPANAADAATS